MSDPPDDARPRRLVVVTGTGTGVGKTWWTAATARSLLASGCRVAVRKPVQSFAADEPVDARDAAVLAAATGEPAAAVCPPHRWLALPLAPPMAAAQLGLDAFTTDDLVTELVWSPGTHVGLVEGVGGLRSPLADDGDTATLISATDPDDVVVVADAGLGAINAVRLVAHALGDRRVVVALNRYDSENPLHRANRAWLTERDGLAVVVDPDELAAQWT